MPVSRPAVTLTPHATLEASRPATANTQAEQRMANAFEQFLQIPVPPPSHTPARQRYVNSYEGLQQQYKIMLEKEGETPLRADFANLRNAIDYYNHHASLYMMNLKPQVHAVMRDFADAMPNNLLAAQFHNENSSDEVNSTFISLYGDVLDTMVPVRQASRTLQQGSETPLEAEHFDFSTVAQDNYAGVIRQHLSPTGRQQYLEDFAAFSTHKREIDTLAAHVDHALDEQKEKFRDAQHRLQYYNDMTLISIPEYQAQREALHDGQNNGNRSGA